MYFQGFPVSRCFPTFTATDRKIKDVSIRDHRIQFRNPSGVLTGLYLSGRTNPEVSISYTGEKQKL